MTIHYLSFASEAGWLGAIHTEADSFIEAVVKTHLLGINPGGEVYGFELPDSIFQEDRGRKILQVLDQLIDYETMQKLFGNMVKFPSPLNEEAE